jgi:SP family myo-inositol transporter-like MFS transporter 13
MVFVRDHFGLSIIWHESIVSVMILSAAIFAIIAGPLSDKIGRKKVVIITNLVFLPGALICGLAPSKEILLFGRFVLGIAVGSAAMVIPIYTAEVAPINIRGRLVILNQVFLFAGQWFSSLVAAIFATFVNKDYAWRWMLGIAAFPALIQMFGFAFMPESPRWLVKKGEDEKAKIVLKKLRHLDETVEKEFTAIKKDVEEFENQKVTGYVWLMVLKDKNCRRALTVGTMMWIIHQFSGVNSV